MQQPNGTRISPLEALMELASARAVPDATTTTPSSSASTPSNAKAPTTSSTASQLSELQQQSYHATQMALHLQELQRQHQQQQHLWLSAQQQGYPYGFPQFNPQQQQASILAQSQLFRLPHS